MRKIVQHIYKVLIFNIVMLLSIQAFTQTAVAPAVGDGTESNPYQIATLENLYWLTQSDTVWDKHFIQTADIDASSSVEWDDCLGFSPIGNSSIKFTGSYYGQGHVIDNVTINRPSDNYIGIFGEISNAQINNLGVTNINIIGNRSVGCLVGKTSSANITNCYTTGICNAVDFIGGLVGVNSADINNCYSKVNISSTGSYVGGLIGINNSGLISSSYSAGKVVGDSYVGGIIGKNYGSVEDCFWDKEVSERNTSAGGVGLTTLEMQDFRTYLNVGWDFRDESYNGTNDIWGINSNENDGYPFLFWQGFMNTLECEAPYSSVSNITFYVNSGSCISLEGFTEAGYGTSGYCIYINSVDTFKAPEDGTEPIADTAWKNMGQQCIYIETSNNPNIIITGLSSETQYFFKIYAYNDCSGMKVYEQNGEGISYNTDNILSIMPEGNGSRTSPYRIETIKNLFWLFRNNMVWDKYYIQTANIDASSTADWDLGYGFTPIGNAATPFTGYYNGNWHTIDNLTIDRPKDSLIGFFGNVKGDAQIENLGLTNIDITGSKYVGGLVGNLEKGTVKNSFTTGLCTNRFSDVEWSVIGGLVGFNGGSISLCYSDVDVTSAYDVAGGLVGVNADYLSSSYSMGDVVGSYCVGGLVGMNLDMVFHSYSRSKVDAQGYSGGLIGDNYGYTIYSFWDMQTSGQSTSVGGEGLSSMDMKDVKTYFNASWDLMDETVNGSGDYWGLNSNENDGYPFLYWQGFINTADIPTSNNYLEKADIKIYPNPVNDIFYIEFGEENAQRITISDMTGKNLLNKEVHGKNEYVDISEFKSGIYLVNIYVGNRFYTHKIVKD